MKNISTLVGFLLLAGCVTAPKVHQFEKTWTLECDFNEAWAATVQLFAEKNWPIANLEKASGLISSDWVSVNLGDGMADCGSAGLAIAHQAQGKFNVFLRDTSSGPSVTVNTSFRQLRSFDNTQWYQDCTSTGVLEATVFLAIEERTK